ncbi:Protein farnesyltransferase subunit beta [Giardia muris]|uniref:Protein farnesyltransferase subunit beta n=1 Tax=Giardia muris TaxID=5742 RepID=A0A4Z1SSE7_GIAMU|nr:Protein farnesyltransferase subunit beta [Giardia muris]|eukprot:TNJ27905.1 Protein farnesyltransferase subunit beta [Giardia muris]
MPTTLLKDTVITPSDVEQAEVHETCEVARLANATCEDLPFEGILTYLIEQAASPFPPVLDSSLAMQFYWFVTCLALMKPSDVSLNEHLAPYRTLFENRLQTWLCPSGGVSLRPGSIPHVMSTFGVVMVCALLHIYEPLDREAFRAFFRAIKHEGGGFTAVPGSLEMDMRTCYTAVASAYCLALLGDELFGLDLMQFILSAQHSDGGFAARPDGNESHAAYTYCALAAIYLLEGCSSERLRARLGPRKVEELLAYLARRQTPEGGFAGRPEKLVDGCYTFWIMGSLELLAEPSALINLQSLSQYILTCARAPNGLGLRDKPTADPDIYHTFYVSSGYLILTHRSGSSKVVDAAFNLPHGLAEEMHAHFASLPTKPEFTSLGA